MATPDQIIAHVNDYQKPVVVTRVKSASNFEDAADAMLQIWKAFQTQMDAAMANLVKDMTDDLMNTVFIKSDWSKQAFGGVASGVVSARGHLKQADVKAMWMNELDSFPSDVEIDYSPIKEYGRRSGKSVRSELLAGAYGNVKIKDDFNQITTNTIS